MSEAQARPHWARLGRELRRLRELAGVTQRKLAGKLHVSQTTIDRTEKGGPDGKPPSWPRVQAWAQECSAANPDLGLLRDLAESALDEHALYRNLMADGLAAVQEDIRGEEAAALMIRNLSTSWVPGLLQTEAYARRMLTLTDYRGAGGTAEAAQARLRRQEVLYDPAHRFEFIITEEGLRRRVVPLPALAVQLAHVAATVAAPNIAFSVIPAGDASYAVPALGFILFEDLDDGADPWVAIEAHHKLVRTAKPEDVGIYQAQYELLRRAAITGDEAVAFVREVGKSLQ